MNTGAVSALPSDWYGLAGLAVVNAVGLVALFLKARGTHQQVANSHSTNLRDDIDGLRDHIVELGRDIGGMRSDVGQLRGEVRDDRTHTHHRFRRIEDKLDELTGRQGRE
ncbi:hypothetical protein PBI_KRATIO_31 [Mycobacterium phage Kratio]|uniref:Minor tail protein n=6 Tax=Kratiovirus TaxID=2948788 RepID=A0A221J747_9CAUD|nr:hypothetical protein CL76_gp69 [Mycobacterium phage Larva]YP_009212777.1 hypothetical protein PBI_KRATIO_31 [Mycobacterium phage Kratio]YP_009950650.1 membrane protein [Mycobacterium phage Collard]ASM62539.1 hypothetical protein SEA_ALLEYCAT_33 [Mycobacterium phage AlleyCat]ASR85729.1 hypothetical protein SEA_EDUGATOR_32 [Mycobacterium phage Edugator]QQV92638.1 hypothetical protein SEA_PSYCHO_33 [Mycobacterium phage Psycho]UEM46426.1 hypothetical protein SEA_INVICTUSMANEO_32 [Mycobacterium